VSTFVGCTSNQSTARKKIEEQIKNIFDSSSKINELDNYRNDSDKKIIELTSLLHSRKNSEETNSKISDLENKLKNTEETVCYLSDALDTSNSEFERMKEHIAFLEERERHLNTFYKEYEAKKKKTYR
jgi:chromosome segregation ATPase